MALGDPVAVVDDVFGQSLPVAVKPGSESL